MEEILRRILPVLLSLFVLVAVSEGGVVLCKSNSHNHRSVHSPTDILRRALGDEYNFYDESLRKESLHDKIRAMLMEDSEGPNYRSENTGNDYSALDASLRADMLRDDARRNEDEWTRRGLGSNGYLRYDNNWYGKYDDDYN